MITCNVESTQAELKSSTASAWLTLGLRKLQFFNKCGVAIWTVSILISYILAFLSIVDRLRSELLNPAFLVIAYICYTSVISFAGLCPLSIYFVGTHTGAMQGKFQKPEYWLLLLIPLGNHLLSVALTFSTSALQLQGCNNFGACINVVYKSFVILL